MSDEEGLWECDGCGMLDTYEAVNDHIVRVNRLADGSLRPPQDVVCWGAMQVGSPAWNAWHFEGIHPMRYVMANLRHIAARFPSLFPEGGGTVGRD